MYAKYQFIQLRDMLEEAVSENDPKPFKLVKWAYQACMDSEELEVPFLNHSFPKHLNFFLFHKDQVDAISVKICEKR